MVGLADKAGSLGRRVGDVYVSSYCRLEEHCALFAWFIEAIGWGMHYLGAFALGAVTEAAYCGRNTTSHHA